MISAGDALRLSETAVNESAVNKRLLTMNILIKQTAESGDTSIVVNAGSPKMATELTTALTANGYEVTISECDLRISWHKC